MLRANAGGHALRQLTVNLAATDTAGAARLRLSAATDDGDRLGLDRIVTYDATPEPGLPLPLLLPVLEDAVTTAPGLQVPGPAAAADPAVAARAVEPIANGFHSP